MCEQRVKFKRKNPLAAVKEARDLDFLNDLQIYLNLPATLADGHLIVKILLDCEEAAFTAFPLNGGS